MLGAIGVVYGDIGTSPLYTMKESFLGPHPLSVDRLHIFGVLSLIFWSLMLIVTVKYVFVAMRADNRGEGGSFALLSLIARNLAGKKWTATLIMLGVLATCLFYGDAMITPAISVLRSPSPRFSRSSFRSRSSSWSDYSWCSRAARPRSAFCSVP
jgi:KUP system potassium uptake protein